MSTANLPQVIGQSPEISAETMEKVVVGGDLARLGPAERLAYYRARCNAVGLDPLSQPFQYLTLNGKMVLYATKGATDQLRKIHKVSVTNVTAQQIGDVYVVTANVQDASGRSDSATGALPIQNLKGEALANALMKCETKAKRRATLSICGLGMLDETEVETIPGAVVHDQLPKPQNNSGNATGQYASKEQIEAYRKATLEFCQEANARWADSWERFPGGMPPDIKDVIHPHQMTYHLLKWAIQTNRLAPVPMTKDGDTGQPIERASIEQAKGYVAIVFARDREALHEEAMEYVKEKSEEAREKWFNDHPEATGGEE